MSTSAAGDAMSADSCQPCVCAQPIMVVCFVRLGFMVELHLES